MPAQSIMKEASDQRGRANPDQSGGINVTDNIQLADALPADVGMIDNNGQELARAKENDARFRSPTLRAGLGLPDEEPIEAIDDAKVRSNRIASVKHMIKHNMTLEQFKETYPDKYASIAMDKNDDEFIHLLAERNREVYSKDPAKAEDTTKRQLKAMGYDMTKLDDRASMYNRISNGTALTVAQGMSGINKFLEMTNMPDAMKFELASEMEKILSETTEADGKLYESLKPVSYNKDANPLSGAGGLGIDIGKKKTTQANTDIASEVGKAAPLVVAGALGGTSATGVVLGDVIPALATWAGNPKATDVDLAIATLPVAGGWALANSLSKWTKRTYDSVEDFEKAVRAEPHLIDDLKVMLKDKKIKLKDIKAFDRPEYLPNRSPAESWFRSDKPTPKEAKASVSGLTADAKSYVENNIDKLATPKELRTVNIDKLVEKYTKIEVDDFFNTLPKVLASTSTNADDFISGIIKYEGIFNELDMRPLVAWAKNTQKLSGSAKANAITQAGVNGLLLASGNPMLANVLPTVFKNWASRLGSQAIRGVKKTLTKPRSLGITTDPKQSVASAVHDVSKSLDDMIE